MADYAAARQAKAIELEDIIVEQGNAQAFLTPHDLGAVAEVRRCALAELGRRRGKRVTASDDTWALVKTFLTDRFGRAG